MSGEVFEFCPKDEVGKLEKTGETLLHCMFPPCLNKGQQDDLEHEAESHQVHGAAGQGARQDVHRLVEGDIPGDQAEDELAPTFGFN